jgi:UTP:GlnB (protein PII) uridylyltransferase
MIDEENWVLVVPYDGEPISNIGYKHHFELLQEIAPELIKEVNYWSAGLQAPMSSERFLACGEIDHLNRIHFKECPGDRNYVHAVLLDKVNALHKIAKTSPFFDVDNLLNLFVARAMNEHIPDEQDIHDVMKYSKNLVGCSTQQIRDCLEGIMKAENPAAAIRLAQESKCLQYLLPEVAETKGFWQRYKNTSSELFQHLMVTLDYVAKHSDNKNLRWAALLHDAAKPRVVWVDKKGRTHFHKGPDGQGANHEEVGVELVTEVFKRLEISEEDTAEVCFFVLEHMFDHFDDKKGAEEFVKAMGSEDRAYDMLTLRVGDIQNKPKQKEGEEEVEEMRKLIKKVCSSDQDWEEVDLESQLIIVLKEHDII